MGRNVTWKHILTCLAESSIWCILRAQGIFLLGYMYFPPGFVMGHGDAVTLETSDYEKPGSVRFDNM